MQAGSILPIRLLSATVADPLNAACNADAAIDVNFAIPNMGIAAGKHARSRVRALAVASIQNLGWDVFLFANSLLGVTGSPDTSQLLGLWSFAALDAKRYTGDANYYYYVDGNDQPYVDADLTGKLHLRLVPRGGNKLAGGAGGDMCLTLFHEITQGI